MEKQKNKRILISAASENDPYNNKNNRDGSINSIIRRYTIENKRIDEIYIVLTLQTALRELYGNVFSKSIKHIDNKIEIHFYPEGIFAEINNNIKLHCSDILQDESLNQEQKINRYVERLIDKDLKLVTVLYYYDDLSISQISEIINIPEGTVKSRLSRARDKIYSILKEEEGENVG